MVKLSHMVLPVSNLQKSLEWYVDKLGFSLERELGNVAGIKDQSGLTIFLQSTSTNLAGEKITLTIQVDNVESKFKELANLGVQFINPPKLLFWGYGAEVLDPDGYMNHLWDETTMRRAMQDSN